MQNQNRASGAFQPNTTSTSQKWRAPQNKSVYKSFLELPITAEEALSMSTRHPPVPCACVTNACSVANASSLPSNLFNRRVAHKSGCVLNTSVVSRNGPNQLYMQSRQNPRSAYVRIENFVAYINHQCIPYRRCQLKNLSTVPVQQNSDNRMDSQNSAYNLNNSSTDISVLYQSQDVYIAIEYVKSATDHVENRVLLGQVTYTALSDRRKKEDLFWAVFRNIVGDRTKFFSLIQFDEVRRSFNPAHTRRRVTRLDNVDPVQFVRFNYKGTRNMLLFNETGASIIHRYTCKNYLFKDESYFPDWYDNIPFQVLRTGNFCIFLDISPMYFRGEKFFVEPGWVERIFCDLHCYCMNSQADLKFGDVVHGHKSQAPKHEVIHHIIPQYFDSIRSAQLCPTILLRNLVDGYVVQSQHNEMLIFMKSKNYCSK